MVTTVNCRDKKDLAEAKRKMDDRKLLINSPAQLTQFCDHIRFDLWSLISHPTISTSEVLTTGLVPTTCCCTSVYSMQWTMADIGMDDRWSLIFDLSPWRFSDQWGWEDKSIASKIASVVLDLWSLILSLIFSSSETTISWRRKWTKRRRWRFILKLFSKIIK